ncbi:MAG: hypothetical protein ILO68_05510 [Clostridia bacterium]|nr:hypothetical protein [Clostridia bacterium]
MDNGARLAAHRILCAVERNHAYVNLSLGPLQSLSPLDASFARALILGVSEKEILLDELLRRFVRRQPDREIQILLRAGLYQILYMDRVPDAAACDETVACAKTLYGRPRADFVNAVLRSAVRSKSDLLSSVSSLPAQIRLCVSAGIRDLAEAQYPDGWEDILEAFNRTAPLFLRCNDLAVSPDELAGRLGGTAEGTRIRVEEEKSAAIRETEQGLCFPQGYGSQEAVRAVGASEGETVVDVCACPGGKSFGMALDMKNKGTVHAFDLRSSKLSAVEKGAARLGLSILKVRERDGRDPDPALAGKADRVLCDVPCSGLGELRSKPDIRKKDPSDFGPLYETQERILASSAGYVRPGGVLVYSTCTWNRLENESRVRAFLKDRPDFRLTEETLYLPTGPAFEGFYVARMEKRT